MIEVWKPVAGYEGRYEISNLGNIASLNYGGKAGNRKNMTPGADKDGYPQIALSKDGKVQWRKVHRLVAEAFIQNPNNYPQVNHKDENVKNNSVDNLEWCTGKYNVNYGTAMKRKAAKQSRPVIGIAPDGTETRYESLRAAARIIGFPKGSGGISAVLNGKCKQSHGYLWKEAEDGKDQ